MYLYSTSLGSVQVGDFLLIFCVLNVLPNMLFILLSFITKGGKRS